MQGSATKTPGEAEDQCIGSRFPGAENIALEIQHEKFHLTTPKPDNQLISLTSLREEKKEGQSPSHLLEFRNGDGISYRSSQRTASQLTQNLAHDTIKSNREIFLEVLINVKSPSQDLVPSPASDGRRENLAINSISDWKIEGTDSVQQNPGQQRNKKQVTGVRKGVYILIAILCFPVWIVLYLLTCCCCCRYQKDESPESEEAREEEQQETIFCGFACCYLLLHSVAELFERDCQ